MKKRNRRISKFAVRIKELRRVQMKTQEQIAEDLRIHRTAYTKYETDTATPDQETLVDMAHLFNVSSDYLLALSDNTGREDTVTGLQESEIALLAEFRHMNKKQRARLQELAVALRKGDL